MFILSGYIKCTKTLSLISSLISCGYVDGGIIIKNKIGLPVHSILFSLLINIFLHSLD